MNVMFALQHKRYILQNRTISYDKIKYNISQMLAILERFLQTFQQFIGKLKNIF